MVNCICFGYHWRLNTENNTPRRKIFPFIAFLVIASFIFFDTAGLALTEEFPQKVMEPPSEVTDSIPSISDHKLSLTYKIPKGWSRIGSGPHSADPDILGRVWGKDHYIDIYAFGEGLGWFDSPKTAGDFVKNLLARFAVGERQKIGVVTVEGEEVDLWRFPERLYPPPPEDDPYKASPGEPRIVFSEFCIVHFGGYFFAFRYGVHHYSAPADAFEKGKEIWLEFLKSVSIISA